MVSKKALLIDWDFQGFSRIRGCFKWKIWSWNFLGLPWISVFWQLTYFLCGSSVWKAYRTEIFSQLRISLPPLHFLPLQAMKVNSPSFPLFLLENSGQELLSFCLCFGTLIEWFGTLPLKWNCVFVYCLGVLSTMSLSRDALRVKVLLFLFWILTSYSFYD